MSEVAILQLILKSVSQSCNLGPIPTPLTKQYFDILVPAITKIINTSLTTGIVPGSFTTLAVKPLLKKPGLGVNDTNNFKPVSRLPFPSNILEKVILA